MNIAVITTFPSNAWDVYAKKMLESYVKYWPAEIPLLVQMDDDLLYDQVDKILRPQDGIAIGWEKDHADFVERNKGKDHPDNYRKQAVKFSHKIFAIKRALDAAIKQKQTSPETSPRYLIWMDADVITDKPVTVEDIKECLPKDGHTVAYLGRKDWDHSECGWLVYDLDNGGDKFIERMTQEYITDEVWAWEQNHDSFIFDRILLREGLWDTKSTNLTIDKPGMDIWQHSPMAKWSTHYKGPLAKSNLLKQPSSKKQKTGGIQIQTKNAIPHEEICEHIKQNQALIRNWVKLCKPNDEEIVVVSAGPTLIAEDVREHANAGKRIVAVKHALDPLKKAGIKPWACILLDPRPHVADFVKDADTDIIWFVASQVNPSITKDLLAKGCTVWGYHASVGAGEHDLTKEQDYAIIGGGSATATRGLFLLNHLGFKNFKLYGYDLCYPDKPDFEAKDSLGQPKYLEISLGMNDPLYNVKKCFWTEPQLMAQFEEMNDMLKNGKFNIDAIGDGVLPFIVKSQKTSNLRNIELKAKIHGTEHPNYRDLLDGNSTTASNSTGKCPTGD